MIGMINLKSVNITNFRSCIETSLDLHPQLTAIIGANGSGKTNTLTALLLLSNISAYRRPLHDKSVLEDATVSQVEFTIEIDKEDYLLAVDIYFDLDGGDDEVIHSELKYRKAKNKKWIPFEAEYLDYISYRSRSMHNISIGDVFRKKQPEDSALKAKIIDYIISISYYGATYFSDPSNSPSSIKIDEKSSRRSYSYSRMKAHERFIYDLYDAYKDQVDLKKYLSVVGSSGIGLIDDISFSEYDLPNNSVKVLSAGKIRQIEQHRLIGVPVFKVGGLSLSPSQLSEGTFKTLALIFYILNDKSKLLLIEEPEVCVHHGLLASVIELIKIQSRERQIIVSTHSDYVLDKLQPENIRVARKDDEKGTTVASLEDLFDDDDYRELKVYLDEEGNLGEYWKESGFLSE